jgi:heme-degrading monooxygenase HmoA
MIARHWRGWTAVHNADAYEHLLKETVLPGLRTIAGYNGGYVLRKESAAEVEFIVINFFESLEAIRKFAGENHTAAVFEPEARRLLSRIEPETVHYEVRADTIASNSAFPQSDREH